jgi:hypothetical protein
MFDRSGPSWDPETWADIRQAMREEMEAAAVVRRFVPHETASEEQTTITVDQFDPATGGVVPDEAVRIIEIYAGFRLTREQVGREATHHEARSAARARARALANGEDYMLLHGQSPAWVGSTNQLSLVRGVFVRDRRRMDADLTYFARHEIPVPVNANNPPPGLNPYYGIHTVTAVESAIGHLRSTDNLGAYAVALQPMTLVDAKVPLAGRSVTPLTLFDRDVGSVDSSRVLGNAPDDHVQGLVVSVGGNSMDLVMPDPEYQIEFLQVDPEGMHLFRLRHRFVLRIKRRRHEDDSPVVRLNFQP